MSHSFVSSPSFFSLLFSLPSPLLYSSQCSFSFFLLSTHGLQMIQLDLTQDLAAQGPFDLILHKVTDLYTSDKPSEKQQFDNLRDFLASNQTLPQIDPLSSVLALTNRVAVLAALSHVAEALGSPGLFRVPQSVVLQEGQRPDLAALKFPIGSGSSDIFPFNIE